MTREDILDLIHLCEFENYAFRLLDTSDAGHWYLQAVYLHPDIVTGLPERQYTRKWLISQHMTKSEIVQTAFKCCITSMEHRCREAFKYRGKRIFGPHFDVDALHRICADKEFDVREARIA